MPNVWTVDTERVPQLAPLASGIQSIWLGAPAAHLRPGDVLVCYSTTDEFMTCDVSTLSEIIDADEESGSTVFDCRTVANTIAPARRQAWRWKKFAFMPLVPSRVTAYAIPQMLAEAFEDPTWPLRQYPDNTRRAIYPDLSKPTIQPETGSVYLMKSPEWYKIGKSLNVEKRRRTLSREHGVELRLIHSFLSSDYSRAELTLLNRYKSKKKQGEMFFLDESDVFEIRAIRNFDLDEIGPSTSS
jgi:hypothetical protein